MKWKTGKGITVLTISWMVIFFLCCTAGFGKVIDGVFININGNAVTFSEFREFVALKLGISEGDAEDYLRNEESKDKLKFLSDAFIDVMLIHFELEKTGDGVKDEEVDEVIQRIVKDSGMTEIEFDKALEQEGLTFQTYRANLRGEMEKSRIIRSLKGNEVLVTDEEAKSFYLEQRDRFKKDYEVKLRMIAFPLTLSEKKDELIRFREILSAADDLAARGGTIEDVERLLIDNGVAAEIIDTGFVSINDLSPELTGDINKLQKGELSQSIVHENRVIYVMVEERSGGEIIPLEEVIDSIKEELVGKRSIVAIKEIIQELRSSSYVEVHL